MSYTDLQDVERRHPNSEERQMVNSGEADERELQMEEARMDGEQRVFTFKITQFVWLVFGLIEGLIGLRVLLRLMAANPGNPFAQLIYGMTEPFVLPFQGLTAQPSAEGFVLEIPSIIAMLVYALLAWTIAKSLWILLYKPRVSK